jgi:hypothetical protein
MEKGCITRIELLRQITRICVGNYSWPKVPFLLGCQLQYTADMKYLMSLTCKERGYFQQGWSQFFIHAKVGHKLKYVETLPVSKLTPRSRIPLENLTVAQLVKEFPHFMETEGSVPCSQEPSTGPCPEPDEPNPHPVSYFSKIHFNALFPSKCRSSKWPLLFRSSGQNFLCIFHLPMRATCPIHFILLDSMTLIICCQ